MTISDAATILTSSVAVLGICLAWSVRNAWKDEKIWVRNTEFRQTLLEKCYEAESNFDKLRRQPQRSRVPMPQVPDTISISQHSRNLGAKVIFDVYDGQSDFWASFFAIEYRARVLLSDEVKKPFDTIRNQLSRFYRAALANSDAADKDETPIEAVDRILWRQENNDPLIPDFKEAISIIEDLCMSKYCSLQPRMKIWSYFFGTS